MDDKVLTFSQLTTEDQAIYMRLVGAARWREQAEEYKELANREPSVLEAYIEGLTQRSNRSPSSTNSFAWALSFEAAIFITIRKEQRESKVS